jgi:hypothetical protein
VEASQSFRIAAVVVLLSGPILAYVLHYSDFGFGEGVVVQLLPGPEKMTSLMGSFITAFAILLPFQTAALFWTLSRGHHVSQSKGWFCVVAELTLFGGLLWAFTANALALIGGVPLARWNFTLLMIVLTSGIALTLFLVSAVLREDF